jgi:hypothetical protein
MSSKSLDDFESLPVAGFDRYEWPMESSMANTGIVALVDEESKMLLCSSIEMRVAPISPTTKGHSTNKINKLIFKWAV